MQDSTLTIKDFNQSIIELIENIKQDYTDDKIIFHSKKNDYSEITQDDITLKLIINSILRLLKIRELSDEEFIELMNVSFIKNFNIKQEYYDYFVIAKILVVRLFEKFIVRGISDDHQRIREAWNGQDVSFSFDGKDNTEGDKTQDL